MNRTRQALDSAWFALANQQNATLIARVAYATERWGRTRRLRVWSRILREERDVFALCSKEWAQHVEEVFLGLRHPESWWA